MPHRQPFKWYYLGWTDRHARRRRFRWTAVGPVTITDRSFDLSRVLRDALRESQQRLRGAQQRYTQATGITVPLKPLLEETRHWTVTELDAACVAYRQDGSRSRYEPLILHGLPLYREQRDRLKARPFTLMLDSIESTLSGYSTYYATQLLHRLELDRSAFNVSVLSILDYAWYKTLNALQRDGKPSHSSISLLFTSDGY